MSFWLRSRPFGVVAILFHLGSLKTMSHCVAGCFGFLKSLTGSKNQWPADVWHSQYEEDAIEPDLPIFDAHHHFFDARIHDKGWQDFGLNPNDFFSLPPQQANDKFVNLEGLGPVFRNTFGYRSPVLRPYMGEQMMADIKGNGKGHNIVGTMYIECGWHTPGESEVMKSVKEVDMVLAENKKFPKLAVACIAEAPLKLGAECEPALKYYKQMPFVKGIRVGFAACDDPSILSVTTLDMPYDPKFREGFALLSKYGYTFDTWMYHTNLPALTDLAKAFPGTTIICDHMAWPLGIGKYNLKDTIPEWMRNMKNLASCSNVNVKIGGWGMRMPGLGFDERKKPPNSDEVAKAWAPYVNFTLETFGVERCIMESNFPMDYISCSYTVYWNALKKIVKNYSAADKKKLFEMNAKRIYRIDS